MSVEKKVRKSYKSLTESDKKEVKKLYKQLKENGTRKYTYEDLSVRFGVSKDTIRRSLDKNNYPYIRVDETKDRRFVTTIDERKTIIDLFFNKGKSRKEISKLTNITYYNVTRLIAKHMSENNIDNGIISQEIAEQIKADYDSGIKPKDICKKYGYEYKKIYYIIKQKTF